ncbi:hypothetical protein K2F40_03875 [Clostridium sp. CM028]|uniref:hypothetical protein n=1 Tax=unclassified Clostridium TaxID=2614128 RepID=UPI001C0E25D7|nr:MULTISPECIES: hypothetical protein [unclassified Clostridium]MBU3093358.1 hypothetical protein [Clostridium sp. CF011]MBW9146743.1 hypothetical protein [Clostridium sp. CM027]MBW9148116.1 hypothetical protein [Clostridium sp. CM028]UVE41597.1 hypothetical protein KTC92_03695 [Clostridium sp. CM027]WAG70590.1 hypothetical protein LL036_03875 [Clostridium sp. CF011]
MLKDEEFLSVMWQKVEIVENEQLEIERILIRDKEIKKRQCFIYFALILMFIGISVLSLFVYIDISIIAILSFITLLSSMNYESKLMKFTPVIRR